MYYFITFPRVESILTCVYVKILLPCISAYHVRMILKCQQLSWSLHNHHHVGQTACVIELSLFLSLGPNRAQPNLSLQAVASSIWKLCGVTFFRNLFFDFFFICLILLSCQHLSDSRKSSCHLNSTGSLEFTLHLRLIV